MRKALKNARHVPVVAFVFRSGERAPPQTDAVMQHLVGEFGRRAMVVALPSDQELINLEKLPAPEFMGDGDGGEGDRELVSVNDILDELAEANDSAEEEEDEGDSGSSSSSLEGVVMVVATPKGKGKGKGKGRNAYDVQVFDGDPLESAEATAAYLEQLPATLPSVRKRFGDESNSDDVIFDERWVTSMSEPLFCASSPSMCAIFFLDPEDEPTVETTREVLRAYYSVFVDVEINLIDTRSPFFGQITSAFSPPLPIKSGPGAVAVMSGGTKFSLFRGVDEQGAAGFNRAMLVGFLEKAELAHHLGVEIGTQW